jgi:hypothetical protein
MSKRKDTKEDSTPKPDEKLETKKEDIEGEEKDLSTLEGEEKTEKEDETDTKEDTKNEVELNANVETPSVKEKLFIVEKIKYSLVPLAGEECESVYSFIYADFANTPNFGKTIVIPVKQTRYVPTNIKIKVKEGYQILVLSYQKLADDNLLLQYSPVILPSDENKELVLPFHNLGNNSVTIENGQKIALFILLQKL